jgi:hypothetical protein
MDGDYCLDINNTSGYVIKNITADDEMYFAFLWRNTNYSALKGIISLWHDSTLLGHIISDDGQFRFYTGVANLLAMGSFDSLADTTYLIELYYKLADSGGRCVLKVNGVTDINYTGDTKPDANTQFNKIRLGDYGYNYIYAYFDNLILDDAAWIGNTKIQKILPTGAGTTTGWTPSAGNNWDCVDERPASDVDYVSINANDAVDTYAAGNMAGTVIFVKCVQVQSRTESDGAPTPTNLKLAVRSGGTDYFSGDKSVPADPKGLYNLWETNPADSAAWEEADVNAVEIGIKSAA